MFIVPIMERSWVALKMALWSSLPIIHTSGLQDLVQRLLRSISMFGFYSYFIISYVERKTADKTLTVMDWPAESWPEYYKGQPKSKEKLWEVLKEAHYNLQEDHSRKLQNNLPKRVQDVQREVTLNTDFCLFVLKILWIVITILLTQQIEWWPKSAQYCIYALFLRDVTA